ncbi:MAG: hypothetical protein C5B53_08735 [Candidatus Melainabacteria bacterium]|nr:MAG: hypothetical protein C5B53_08735 [Candidatus Melainabacteria bacterium]
MVVFPDDTGTEFSEVLMALQAAIDERWLLPSACGYIVIDDYHKPPFYWNGTSFRHRCDDPEDMENPHVFASRARAEQAARQMNNRWTEERKSSCKLLRTAIAVLWIHPQHHYKPLAGLRASRNVQFPGSPHD